MLPNSKFEIASCVHNVIVQSLTSYLSRPRALGAGVTQMGLPAIGAAVAIEAAPPAADENKDSRHAGHGALDGVGDVCAFRVVKADTSRNKLLSVAAGAGRTVAGGPVQLAVEIHRLGQIGDEMSIEATPLRSHDGLQDMALVLFADSNQRIQRWNRGALVYKILAVPNMFDEKEMCTAASNIFTTIVNLGAIATANEEFPRQLREGAKPALRSRRPSETCCVEWTLFPATDEDRVNDGFFLKRVLLTWRLGGCLTAHSRSFSRVVLV